MTNEEILKKVILKAEKNGYKFAYNLEATQYNSYYYAFIFSHYFAKAFWGEEKSIATSLLLNRWQYHLQQMVLKEEPLKYLERFIRKEE